VNLSAESKDGRTAMHLAICNGHAEAVKSLIDGGVDPSVRDEYGRTPLDYAKEDRIKLEISKTLSAGRVDGP
jgi:ankyrin repeat protein